MGLSPIKPRPEIPGDEERYQRDLESVRLNPAAWGRYAPSPNPIAAETHSPDEAFAVAIQICNGLLDKTKKELIDHAESLKLPISQRDSKEAIIKAILTNHL